VTEPWIAEWDETAGAIGRELAGGEKQVAADLVEAGAIRRYCEPLELACPLHHDEAAAREAGYRGIVAPVSGISSRWSRGSLWEPGEPTSYPSADRDADMIRRPEGRMSLVPGPRMPRTFATDVEVEHGAPVCVGDRLTTSGLRLVSVVPKETSVGRGAFVTTESAIHNQLGELVATVRHGGFQYRPRPYAPDGGGAPEPADDPTGLPEPEAAARAPAIDWSQQRLFEDVAVGDELAPVSINLTVTRLIVEAGANLDFSQVHHHADVARATGAPDMYANNIFIQGWWERTVREFIGLRGRFKRTGPLRMRIFNTVGETVTTRGVVRRMWRENGESLLELEMRTEMTRGVSVGPGPVIVTLPSRH
jgi:acyl dehydratase